MPQAGLGPFSLNPQAPSRILRSSYAGVLLIGDRPLRLTYVLDPATGCPVVPLAADGPEAPSDDEAQSLVLCIPDDGDGSLQMLCSAADIDPHTHEAADRHLIYHGPARQRRWVLLRVESARVNNKVFDPALVIAPNPLRRAEPALCKRANARKDHLAALSRARGGPSEDRPVMVGIDPAGMDVRTRFGILRIDFDRHATNQADAEQILDALLDHPQPPTTPTPT
ncbi:MAG: DUF2470 domain-containing protein [Phycisphaerales bacterium]|nr:DUF2470 domain-containing protein [Phycisphaerales bacterium]